MSDQNQNILYEQKYDLGTGNLIYTTKIKSTTRMDDKTLKITIFFFFLQ